MASVTKLQTYGNQIKIIYDDGSVALAYPAGMGLYVAPGIKIQEYGNQLKVIGSGGNAVAYTVPGSIWYVGPGGSGPTPGGDWVVPLDNWASVQVTDNYGPREGGAFDFHYGIDLSYGGIEGADIHAVAAGTVDYIRLNTGKDGYVAAIAHGDGSETIYQHMNATPLVGVGDHVAVNQVIGHVGATGDATGPHLHFQCQNSPNASNDDTVDPRIFMATPARLGHDPFPPYDGE